MSAYRTKAPQERLEYRLDWGLGYLLEGEIALEDLGWTVQPAAGPGAIRVVRQEVRARASLAVLEGGVPGQIYLVSACVRTDRGRVLRRTAVIGVRCEEMAA